MSFTLGITRDSAFKMALISLLTLSASSAIAEEASGSLVQRAQVRNSAAESSNSALKGSPTKDGIFSDKNAPDQQLILQLVDDNELPLAGVEVELITSFESVSKGGNTKKRTALTDQNGAVIFQKLSPALRYSHRLIAKSQGGFFATDVFRMRPKGGLFARLHVYPTTNQLSDTLVGSMGFIYVSQREDVLKVEMLFRIINVGKNAWIPSNIILNLPSGYHGVEVPGAEGQRFKRHSEGVQLEGTFGPGQHDLSFAFLLHRKNNEHQSISIPLLPNLADLRVMTDAIAEVELSVPSFPTPELRKNPSGKGMVLFTERQMKPGQGALKSITVDLDGLPTRGVERWLATGLALLIALLGILLSLMAKKKYFSSREEKEEAQQLLLRELLALEQAKKEAEVGPRAYRQARQELLIALARLEEIENQEPTASA